MLLLCEFYRQRFFLDPQQEVGIHWRSQVLAYAKWPIFLLAIYDVLTRYRGMYTITRKVRATSKHYILFVPHILVVALIVTAWGIGMILRHITNPLLHISSVIIVLSSLGVMLTGLWRFPDPYERDLWRQEREDGSHRTDPRAG
jgi:hypothetical protein